MISLAPDSDIRARLAQVRLPSMPQILLRLMHLCQSDDAGIPELADLIGKDAGMTARILAVANSSAYHRSHVLGLEHALMTIGTDMVKTLVISESVFQVFDSMGQGADLRSFWKHALGAAAAARLIAQKTGYPNLEEAYLAGLLHDAGRLALLAAAPREYAFNFQAADDDNLCAVEQRTLQITHAEAGAWIIEHWRLDSFLSDAVLYHHEPAARLAQAHPLIRIVFLANQLFGHSEDEDALAAAGALCDIPTLEDLAAIHGRIATQIKQAADFLGIDLSGADTPPPTAQMPPLTPDDGRKRLAMAVRDLVLKSEAGRTFAKQPGETKLLETAVRSARLLFGFDDAAVLMLNEAGDALQGTVAGSRHQRLAGFTIPLPEDGAVKGNATPLRSADAGAASNLPGSQEGNATVAGIIAGVALRQRPAFVERGRQSVDVHEEQLLRMFDTGHLVCLPLTGADRCLGVLIGSVAPQRIDDLRARESFLKAFGQQAGASLDALARERTQAELAAAEAEEKHREASRRTAHEISNPLAIIRNYLGVLDRKLAKQQPVTAEISILNEEIDRVGQLVNGLSEPRATSAEETAEVNQVMQDVVRLFRDTEYIAPSLDLEARTLDRPCDIACDADVLKQILVNLVKNAIEALADGGAIEIRNEGFVNRDGRLFVELLVVDNGPGLAPDIMNNLFSPVRSTKGAGHRGIGLSIVHGLVRKMQGRISCRSGQQGTTFELLLPAASTAAQEQPPRLRNWAQA